MQRAKDRELLQGKGNPGANYRMTIFRDVDTMPAGSIVCAHDLLMKSDGTTLVEIRAWVPVPKTEEQ